MAPLYLRGENPWKLAAGFLALAFFFGMGLAHVINPDYFLRRSAIRKGGEMLNEFNRVGIQFVGLVVAAFAAGVFYEMSKDLLHR